MNNILTGLLLLIALHTINAQEKIISISPDGTLQAVETGEAAGVIKINNLSPFHTSPSWTAMRDRQVGGMAFGDYDGDGDLDLAVGCYYSNSYPPINEYENFIFRNDNGVLDTIPAWITADERSTTDIRWGDINGDGKIDLISANGNFSGSTIYFNSASGLSATAGWISNDNVWTVGSALCDIDGNGWPDLAFGNQGVSPDPYKPIQIFFNNNGSLNTNPEWTSTDYMITNSVAFTDIDKNTLVKVNSLSYTADGISSVYNIPKIPVYEIDSVKVNGVKTEDYCMDEVNGWISLGFLPQNGAAVEISYKYVSKGDMAAVKWSSFESGIYFNNNGVLNTYPGWTNGNTSTQKGAAWADFDLDGYMDLAIGGSGGPSTIFRNINGVMSTSPVWSSASSSTSAQEIAAADVNRDGYPDLAVVHFGTKRIEIFFNLGGTLETIPSWTYIAGSSATSIAFGDVNNDGWLDLAVGTARAPVVLFIADPSLVPVEFSSFTANTSGDNIVLKWITASEINNKGFEIQRKKRAENFWENIGSVKGSGTSTEVHHYSYTDYLTSSGIYQYRIKQVDFDGTINYSKSVEIEFLNDFTFKLEQNYPNPFNPSTKIKYIIPYSANVEFIVCNLLGQEVYNEKFYADRGIHEINYSSGNLSSGVYFYSIKTDQFISTRKFVLMK